MTGTETLGFFREAPAFAISEPSQVDTCYFFGSFFLTVKEFLFLFLCHSNFTQLVLFHVTITMFSLCVVAVVFANQSNLQKQPK
jgi:hypothetical protein